MSLISIPYAAPRARRLPVFWRRQSSTAAGGSAFHIPSLDGIRAVAFLIVFTSHAGMGSWIPGGFGVTLFFFLSGYLITTLMRVEQQQTGTLNIRHFYLRRVLRILPPFYLVLLTAILLTHFGILNGTLEARAVIMQLVHVSNYHFILNGQEGIPAGVYPFWSLAVEEHFYLIFPWLYLAMLRFLPGRRDQVMLLGAVCLIVLVWRCVLVLLLDASVERTAIASDTRVDSIIFGCILALVIEPRATLTGMYQFILKFLLTPFSLAILLATFVVRDDVLRETVRYTLQGLALIPLFMLAVHCSNWLPLRLLNLRPVRYIGLLSYSLYLMHQILIFNLYDVLPGGTIVKGLLILAVALAIAALLWRLVEQPCARLRRRLAHGKRVLPADRPAPAHPTTALAPRLPREDAPA